MRYVCILLTVLTTVLAPLASTRAQDAEERGLEIATAASKVLTWK